MKAEARFEIDFEERWEKLDSMWNLFIETADAFSAQSISQFMNMLCMDGGAHNFIVAGWAYTRFGIENQRGICGKLRDVASEQDPQEEVSQE